MVNIKNGSQVIKFMIKMYIHPIHFYGFMNVKFSKE